MANTKLTPPTKKLDDLQKFDQPGFAKKYIKQKDGFNEISLIIEGIHCSACVWLNEKILYKTDGVLEVDINYTTNKAKVLWDDDSIKLSQIIQKIRSIGYDAYAYDPSKQEEIANKKRKEYYAKLLVGIFCTMNIMWIAIAQYAGYFSGMSDEIKNILNIAGFILATPVLFYTGWVYFKGAYYGLKNRFVNMDLLVATGASLTYIYSIYAMISKSGETYFESVAMIITFVFVGKYLEVLSKKKAIDTYDALINSIPTEVIVIKNEKRVPVSVDEIKVGDIIEIKAGEKVIIDGIVISGEGTFDESSLTGESKPIYKKRSDELISGTICNDSLIRYRATKDFASSTLFTIISLIEDSISKKPHIEKIANQISGYFSNVILAISILTFIGWYIYSGDFERSLIIAISVIVIACPCALGLATPVATLVGFGEGVKRGILFKQASFLETMAKCDVVLLDKTGTITEGKPKVVKFEKFETFDINLLYSLTKSSNHPIAKGVNEYLKQEFKNLKEYDLKDIKNIQAKGISANYNNQILLGGNIKLLKDRKIEFETNSENSIFIFAINSQVVAKIELKDKVKKGTKEVIKELKKLDLEVVMLTGDNEKIAKNIANEVGITKVYSSLMPQDKAKIIDKYHQNKKITLMVGDGINDALALSKSDIAIAMGSGADICIEVSDVVLLHDSMDSLLYALKISKNTYKSIKQNLFISLLYNVITIPLAVAGYVIPLIAALSMSLSSLLVVGNSIRNKKRIIQ